MAAVCPSTGPRGGETRVVISGSELKHGADPYCRFPVDGGAPPGSFWGGGGGGGGVHVTAAWSADQAAVVAASRGTGADGRPALVCVAPLSAAASAAALEISLNGQDFSSDLVHYGFVDPPAPAPLSNPKPRPRPNPKPRPNPGRSPDPTQAPAALSPSCGPTGGGTAVNVSGGTLVGGSHLRCSFGGAPPLGGFDGLDGPGGFEGRGERARGLLIEANASGYAPSLRCLTPARASGRANVSVSPNAQQYSSPPLPFVYYAPPVVSHCPYPYPAPAPAPAPESPALLLTAALTVTLALGPNPSPRPYP